MVILRRNDLAKFPFEFTAQKNQQMTSRSHKSFAQLLCWILTTVQFSKMIYDPKALIHDLQDAHQPALPSPPPPESAVRLEWLSPFSSLLHLMAFELQRGQKTLLLPHAVKYYAATFLKNTYKIRC